MNIAPALTAQTVPVTRVYAPHIVEIHWAQPVAMDGYPAGPVYWTCPESGAAGRLFLDVRATPEMVASNLHRSMRAPYAHVRDHIASNGLSVRGLLYDWRSRALAQEQEIEL